MTEVATQEKIQEISNKIVENYKPEKIILFGSYAWGNPGPDSDVDLFIVKETGRNIFERNRDVGRILFGSDVAIDVLVYTPEQLEKREQMGDPFINKIISNGKIIYEQSTE